MLWGAAALGTAAAIAAYSYPYGYGYGYGYGGYAPAYTDPYASYASYGLRQWVRSACYGYGNGYGYRNVYASSYDYGCVATPQLVWNGWAYRRVWIQAC